MVTWKAFHVSGSTVCTVKCTENTGNGVLLTFVCASRSLENGYFIKRPFVPALYELRECVVSLLNDLHRVETMPDHGHYVAIVPAAIRQEASCNRLNACTTVCNCC